MTLPAAALEPAAHVVLNAELVQRVARSDRDVVLSGSLYAVPPSHRTAAAQVLAQHGLWVHADVFADARTGVSVDLIAQLADEGAAPIDVHLLTVAALAALPAVCRKSVARVTFPFEGVADPEEIAAFIREAGAVPWLAISPGTTVEECVDALPYVDGLLVMLLEPGTRGHARAAMLPKVTASAGQRPVGVDGGVGESILDDVLAVGASYVVVGRRLFAIHPHAAAKERA